MDHGSTHYIDYLDLITNDILLDIRHNSWC